ncbi:MAG TPA: DNA repair protein RadA [Phycisphaerae bacterium]|nr:DNA repair protein RadA [Phycisphaerae bacterium]
MARKHSNFICESCGRVHAQWMGKCPDCGEWNTLVEQVVEGTAEDKHRPVVSAEQPILAAIKDVQPDATRRYPSGIAEFDRVLGGGIVPGSAILIGGDPGIGKSTLLLQVGHALATAGKKAIYVSSEESLGQIRLRAARLNFADSPMLTAAQANLDIISNLIQQQKPDLVVVDSVQMVYRPDMTAAPGSVTQLRDAAARLIWLAKQMGFALVLVGHVTKEGAIAGPMILEHLVDCVAYFEGDRFHSHRLIRAVKNRFGSTDELGIFEMTDAGLIPIADPSKLFLQSGRQARPGSVVLAACEGTRTLLVEVQALCAQSVFGSAKRKATGVDAGRVSMILAVIEKHADCVVGDQDVFVNVVGGVRVNEPAADLAIALAVVGAMTNRSLPATTVVCGELGLGAELRPVHHLRQRITEAARVGFKQFILPRGEQKPAPATKDAAIELLACESLSHALRQLA